jgi:hypothetical protein
MKLVHDSEWHCLEVTFDSFHAFGPDCLREIYRENTTRKHGLKEETLYVFGGNHGQRKDA